MSLSRKEGKEEEENLTCGDKKEGLPVRGTRIRARMGTSPARGHALRGQNRLRRGCAEVPFVLDYWQDEKWDSRKPEGMLLAGDTQTCSRGL